VSPEKQTVLLLHKCNSSVIHIAEFLAAHFGEFFHFSDLSGRETGEVAGLQLILIHFIKSKRELDIVGNDRAVTFANDEIALTVEQKLNSRLTHHRCGKTVAKRRRTAADNVSETVETSFNARSLLDTECKSLAVGLTELVFNALGNNDHEASSAVTDGTNDPLPAGCRKAGP